MIVLDYLISLKLSKIFNVEGEELEYSLSGNTLTVSGDGFGTVKLNKE